jgi:hypothetical protein
MADAILAVQPTIISRADAIAQGLRRYFTGKPCIHGHIAPRNVGNNNECIGCKTIRDKAFQDNRKPEKFAYDRKYRERNAERLSAKKALYRSENRETLRAKAVIFWIANSHKKKLYREANKDRRSAQKRAWVAANAEHVSAYKKVYDANKMMNDLNYKLRINLRIRLATAVREGAKAGSAVRDLGCSIEELKAHLEAKFTSGMSWENWGRMGWHIDHRKPLAAFDLTNEAQAKEACHYTNLQPLWRLDNIAKGARLDWVPPERASMAA